MKRCVTAEERKRLIEIFKKIEYTPFPEMTIKSNLANQFTDYALNHIVDEILANGVIVPPCKVGDTVYVIEKNCLACIHYTDGGYTDWCECTLDDDNKLMFECDFDKECIYSIIPKPFNYGMLESLGKTVFLAREEAESALQGVK